MNMECQFGHLESARPQERSWMQYSQNFLRDILAFLLSLQMISPTPSVAQSPSVKPSSITQPNNWSQWIFPFQFLVTNWTWWRIVFNRKISPQKFPKKQEMSLWRLSNFLPDFSTEKDLLGRYMTYNIKTCAQEMIFIFIQIFRHVSANFVITQWKCIISVLDAWWNIYIFDKHCCK